jgi:hypothetical protein
VRKRHFSTTSRGKLVCSQILAGAAETILLNLAPRTDVNYIVVLTRIASSAPASVKARRCRS